MAPLLRFLLPLLLLLLALFPARAEETADLVRRLEDAGARVLRVPPGDPRLGGEGRVSAAIGAGGVVEVYLPESAGAIRTPLRTPTERLTVEEFKALTAEMRAAVRSLYGIEVEAVFIAGSSSGIPFRDPGTGELRTFDRKGARTSDYDGALVSKELFELIEREAPRTVRGRGTGKRTAPDPLPALRQRFHEIGQRWGRKVAAMVYASQAEFDRRMELTGLTVGENVMREPGPRADAVAVTRAELLGALLEVEQLRRLVAAEGPAGAQALLQAARQGQPQAQARLRQLRRQACETVLGRGGLGEVETGLLRNELLRLGEASGFAPARPGGPTPDAAHAATSEAEARGVFEATREGARLRAEERLAGFGEAERPAGRAALARVGEAGLEVVKGSELLLEYRPETNAVRVSEALLEALRLRSPGTAGAAFRRRALGLLFAHELGHAAGLKAEAAADAEAVRAYEKAPGLREQPLQPGDARRVLELFQGQGGSLAEALSALRGALRYGTPTGRAERLERAIEGLVDPVERFRRVDGTLEWRRMLGERALVEAGGLAHFGLALFLKELAVVARTGDRARIDEFFDGLLSTDFFQEYGLFTLGARAGDVAWSRFLQGHLKPGFASAILRQQVVLATGMALPALVRGDLGPAFLIDLGALGLSAAAVRTGLAAIEWVVDLKRVAGTGKLARLARVGGWFYSAAETAVVLYMGDELARAARDWVDARAARNLVAERTLALLTRAPGATPAELAELVDGLDEAHVAWRDLLLRPAIEAEGTYLARVARAAREAKRLSDVRDARRLDLSRFPGLTAHALREHETVEAYLLALTREREAALERDLAGAMQTLTSSRGEALRVAYQENRRAGPYLRNARLAGLTGLGGVVWNQARQVSQNRLQAYDDELVALREARRLVAGDPARAAVIDAGIAFVREVARRDGALLGEGFTSALTGR